MPPLKQRIFNLVRRAGPDGIPGDDLWSIIYDGQTPRYHGSHHDSTRQRTTLKAHIWQINRGLDRQRIVGRGGSYRLLNLETSEMRDWQDTITGDDATEALAEAWASIDGKLEAFRQDKGAPDYGQGYYAGYRSDANELRRRLLKRGYAIVAIELRDKPG